MQKRNYHKYTDEQFEFLKENGPLHTRKELANIFNEKFNANQSIRKLSEYSRKHGIPSKYSDAQELEANGTFKKGRASWNKGVKGYMGANSTSFKKGQVSRNHRPVGSERIDTEGYIYIKVADPSTWKQKHHITWEKYNGEIPKGHAILFGDGDKLNVDIENLICISRAQLARFNQGGMKAVDVDITKTAINIINLEQKLTDISK